jgi:hypothetical protein
MQREAPNKEAALETVSTEGLIWGPAINHGILEPMEKKDQGDAARETPKGPKFWKRRRMQLKCSNGIRD